MKNIYLNQLKIVSEMDNNSEKLVFLTSILRSILQLSVISSFEITKNAITSEEFNLLEMINRFHHPSDGLPLQILDSLTPVIRTYVLKSHLNGWFEKTKLIEVPLSKQLKNWVEFRNKRPGHGVLDSAITLDWVNKTEALVLDCLSIFSDILPEISLDGELLPLNKFNGLKIKTPIYRDGHAIVVLAVNVRKGIWKLKGQLLSFYNASEFTIELEGENIFNTDSLNYAGEYKLADVICNNESFSFFHNIPVRQTDIFEGRKGELQKLQEWIDDEDSRYCLVYGDGGYGKTTLVLELLNLLLESQYDFKRQLPTIISYNTAKMTRWNDNGLVHLTGTIPVMDECLRELVRCFTPILKSEWYEISGRKLIDKVVTVLKDNKLTRDDVLLIIDNTETLATNSQEVKDLGEFIKTIGKLIGRVIVTSRRREYLEATPIAIEGLSEMEGVNLMQRLATEFGARPIKQAGEPKLRKVSAQLMNKPILLEALVKYVARGSSGIDMAIDNIFRKSNEDLLEFLYEDAWQRMSQLQKKSFLILINLSSPLDQNTISRTCQEIKLQQTEFQDSLEETHFAILTDYGRTYTIELVELSKRFFLQQFAKLENKEKESIKNIAKKIDLYAEERERIDKEYKTDRIAEAFRSEYAKAAKIYVDKGDDVNAFDMYQLAIEDDPVNSALHDRFSWFLLNKTNKYEYAKKLSEKAVELDGNNCDAIVGLALVHYRLGNIFEGDKYIDRAQSAGRSLSFCFLRKAIARYHLARDEENIDDKINFLEESIQFLEQANKNSTNYGGYDAKNKKDIQRYLDRGRRHLNTQKANRTRKMKLDAR